MNNQQLLDIISQMTLDEKIAQLQQLTVNFFEGAEGEGEFTGPREEMGINEEVVHNAGSILNYVGAKKVKAVQDAHLKNNRNGIPLLFMADVVHGFKTIFPIPLAMGCSWDMDQAEQNARVAAKESAVSGLHVTFAPMVDLVRDPRWGRVMESTGEDPYLNSLFARAFIRGFQGGELSDDRDRIAACVKHFAAYGAVEGGREYNTVDLSELQLHESYLPSYRAALDEGAAMVMASFNVLDGIPASGNVKLMRQLLREEWGFDGVLISDWASIKEMIAHGVAEDEAEAALKAMRAGLDIEMMTPCYVHHLADHVTAGRIDEQLIDDAVLRILQLKQKLGLFENPYHGADPVREAEMILCEEHREIARQAAIKSSVLLKNENSVLPLAANQCVALIGPFASSNDILGQWSCVGDKEDAVILEDAMIRRAGAERIIVAEGSGIYEMTEAQWAEAETAAKEADVIVLALGEESIMSGEARCRTDITLPAAQRELLRRAKGLGKPVAVVLFNGRPLDLSGVYDVADALLEVWFPGTEGGAAITSLLYGDAEPTGRLSMSFPVSAGQIPVYYNNYNTGRPLLSPYSGEVYVSRYLDAPNEPLLPFGYGLSYTTFTYSEPKLSDRVMNSEGLLKVTVSVTNCGPRAGEEVVQLYVRDWSGDVIRPLKELKDFAKIKLAAGETRELVFELTEEQLRYTHSDLSFSSDNGKFTVFVGPNSRDVQSIDFVLDKQKVPQVV